MEEKKHLSQGSTHPPVIKGSLRLYVMRFCPFAQRALLVAEAKKIKYDTVNVDLSTKPDWFLALNPRGEAPTLEFEDGDWLGESIIISDFLEELGSDGRSLYPETPRAKAKDRLIIDRFNEFTSMFFKLMFAFGKPDQDFTVFDKMVVELQKLETELAARGTNFFGGSLPGMVDYMIWPWFEREGVLRMSDSKLDIFKDRLPGLTQWCARMREDPAVQKWHLSTDVHTTYLKGRLAGNVDYDCLVENK